MPEKEVDSSKEKVEDEKKPKKQIPEGLVIPPKKPKLTKAERRALQEQQRAAKAARQNHDSQQQQQQGGAKTMEGSPKPQHYKSTNASAATASGKKHDKKAGDDVTLSASKVKSAPATKQKSISMVSHLAPYQDPSNMFTTGATLTHLKVTGSLEQQQQQQQQQLHPSVLETGYQYASGQIRGGNARCRAMLQCYRTVLQDFVPPTSANGGAVDLRHVVDSQVLKPAFHYWTEYCRPHSVSMGNAFTFLKTAVASLDRELDYPAMREILEETSTAYERERIDYADRAIAELACQKLLKDQSEVLLIYGYSEVITALLHKAVESKKEFRVILVDSRPLLEGRKQLEHLRAAGIECSYILLNALTYVLQDVTKVLLGAAALMSDGSVCGRVGSAAVAMAAHAQNVPVLILSETYKISNRVQLESITSNELGDPNALAIGSLKNWQGKEHLKLLNLVYDLTPSEFVSGIVTELGIIPPTSVAVLLREMNPQDIKST